MKAVQRADTPAPTLLTVREREVLELIQIGLSYKQVADQLGTSMSTVNNHMAHVREKLGAHNGHEAIIRWSAESHHPL